MTGPENINMSELDRLQRTDHDTLTRLETKVDYLTSAIKSYSEGFTQRIVDLEHNVRDLQKQRDEVNVPSLAKEVEENTQWRRDFKLTYRVIIAITTAVGAIIGFAVSILVKFIQ